MDFWFLVFLFTVAILIAVGGALLLVGYMGTLPASFDHGWRVWAPTLLLPLVGPLWFAYGRRAEFVRPGTQLLLGLLLIAAAFGLLYGAGPHFVDRIAAGVK
jgi:hypothetical protein